MIMFINILLCLCHVAELLNCDNLLPGQYFCEPPEINIDTQAEKDCQPNRTVQVWCQVAPGIMCDKMSSDFNKTGFYKKKPCRYIKGKSFKTAMLLSIFLGVFGIDRIYLGYPAIGLFKFCTLGFFMIFQFVDVILLATQILKPADGSDFYMDYFGHRLIHIATDNETIWYK
ncbi:TM2 domain-containing protein 1 [Hydra vulgaris]|uniref:TM2 domain-containing protein 1 n=1 Tax=Hydra vulgaris TaxID=6087 RepID=A0ABM4CRS7_HYDVU